MAWIEDGLTEFRKLPKGGKIAAVGILVLVIGIAYYEYRKGQSASVAGTSLAGSPSTTGTGQSPFPSINGQPLLPSGTNPIFDPNGNVIGYQSPPPPTSTPPTSTPTGPFSWLGNIPLFSRVWEGGVNSNGTQRWWFTPAGSTGQTEFDVPVGTKIWQGAQGRWWDTLPGGTQQQLTGPSNPVAVSSTIPVLQPGSNNGTFQANHGGPNLIALMNDPSVYTQSATPHITSQVR